MTIDDLMKLQETVPDDVFSKMVKDGLDFSKIIIEGNGKLSSIIEKTVKIDEGIDIGDGEYHSAMKMLMHAVVMAGVLAAIQMVESCRKVDEDPTPTIIH
jgi:hypothetical protein